MPTIELFVFYTLLFFSQVVAQTTINTDKASCEEGMKATAPIVENLLKIVQSKLKDSNDVGRLKAVLEVCERMLGESKGHLDSSMQKMQSYSMESLKDGSSDDIWTWMSAAVTDHSTCIDELQDLGLPDLDQLIQNVKRAHLNLHNSLALFFSMRQLSANQSVHGRKLLSSVPYQLQDGLPNWLLPEQRRHLLQTTSANIVVAKDGSGQYTSIQAAINAASPGNVIYVKSGTYFESVVVNKNNLVIMGDGIGKTIITGSKYFAETGNTFKTQTVDVQASGFIGKYLTIQNTASADKHQALALLVSGDKASFYKCSFDAYQDTVCTFTNRQFYSECQVIGSVDFIFGNAAAVFQQCSIYAKSRAGHERTTITAQGRESSSQNTGLSFIGCSVDGANSKTFLGRPWKDYSRVIFMNSQLSSAIDPEGWFRWKSATYRAETVYYGEYQNTGAGADRTYRVTWSKELSAAEASKFTISSFIGGW